MIYINLLIIILLIITIHEFGHYFFARFFGAEVTIFSIGFGKSLFQFKDKNNTIWKISFLPLGGYVKIKGLDTIFNKQNLIEKGSFQSLKLYQKIIILLAGSFFNIISAWFLILCLLFFFGIASLKPKISEVVENSPAFHAGLLPGDLIINVNNSKINNFDELVNNIINNNELIIEVVRNDEIISFFLETKFNEELKKNTIGIKVSADDIIINKYNFSASISQSFKSIYNFYIMNFSLLKKSYFENNLSNDLAGPIGIIKNADKFSLNSFVGIINLFIAFSLIISLFNLLPIPLLDGGHILYFTISRIFSNSMPELITKIYLVTGVTIISFLFIVITFNDIFYK